MDDILPDAATVPRFGSVDDNNNSQKYSLRPRASQRRCRSPAARPEEKPPKPKRSRRDKRQHPTPPLSKYRRKTANARERSRMREINEAFEALRRAVPQVAHAHAADAGAQSEKTTKISTLRLAMEYITALHRALGDSRETGDLPPAASRTSRTSPPPPPPYPEPSLCDFEDLSLTPPDRSPSSTSDVSDLFLISLDLDRLPSSASLPAPDRTFAGFDQFAGPCSFDDVLFAGGLS